jgi:hypothetical protein
MTSSNPVPSGPKKGRSPWMWVGLGCGLTVLLAFGGCVALMGVIGQRAAQEMGKPITQKEAMAKLGDIPIYKPSTFDENMTKGVRFSSSLMPGEMMTAAAFGTSDEPDKIIDWYQKQLSERGYQKLQSQPTFNSKITQANFKKDSESILVQIHDATTGGHKYTMVLMHIKLPISKPAS